MPAPAQALHERGLLVVDQAFEDQLGPGPVDHLLQGGEAGDGCMARAERVVFFHQADDPAVGCLQGGLDHAADVAVVDAHDADAHDRILRVKCAGKIRTRGMDALRLFVAYIRARESGRCAPDKKKLRAEYRGPL